MPGPSKMFILLHKEAINCLVIGRDRKFWNLLCVTPTSSQEGKCSNRPASGNGSRFAISKVDKSTSGKGLGGNPIDENIGL